ncbi:MAG: hypothetical protein MJK04_20500, partial [Psychrosphaera sp.]|nr:hypothetical protein [Psychrosphaera sp.]
ENVNELLLQTVGEKTKSSGLKAPKITTSYLLGQGLTIAISPIQFSQKNNQAVRVDVPVVAERQSQVQPQRQETQAARTIRVAYRHTAKELAHAAYNLREQGKSLRKSLGEAGPEDKAALNQKIEVNRTRAREVGQLRKEHAAVNPQNEPARGAQSKGLALGVKKAQLAKVSYRQRFYQALVTSVAETLCQQANVFSTIDDEEKISVIYLQGGDKQQNTFNVKGWIVDKSLLSRCAKGEIDQQYLAKQVTEYQY